MVPSVKFHFQLFVTSGWKQLKAGNAEFPEAGPDNTQRTVKDSEVP